MMKKFLTAAAVMVALFSTTTVKAAYINDPTFTTPPLTANYAYTPSNPYWTFTGNSGIVTTGQAGYSFGNTSVGGLGLGAGAQAAFLQSSTTGSGVITQAITTAPTGVYALSFYAETRAGYPSSSFTVSVGGFSQTFTPTTSGSYTLYTSNAFSITGATTLTLTAITGAGVDTTSFVTGFSLAAVPEPASVGMLGLGLIASAGFAVRKARRNRA